VEAISTVDTAYDVLREHTLTLAVCTLLDHYTELETFAQHAVG